MSQDTTTKLFVVFVLLALLLTLSDFLRFGLLFFLVLHLDTDFF